MSERWRIGGEMADRRQRTFASGRFDVYRRTTRRERFLREMNQAMPWQELTALIEPHYPKEGQPGRPITPLPWMIKFYFLQIWFGLSDSQTEEMMHDSHAVQEFLRLDLGRDRPPDETTILRFRHLIEKHYLAEQILRMVNAHLEKAGIRVRAGTIVDATVIAAPRSTKNESGQRDPEMASTKKGDQWQFGAKLHVGVDSRTKVVHTLQMTPANVHDGQVVEKLLHGGERRVYGDKAYVGKEEAIRSKAPGEELCGAAGRAEPPLIRGGEAAEPSEIGDSLSGGAYLRCDQAPFGLAKGAVSGNLQELAIRLGDGGVGQRLSSSAGVDEKKSRFNSGLSADSARPRRPKMIKQAGGAR